MENNNSSSSKRARHTSRSRKPRQLDATAFIKLLRKHRTLTLTVCVLVVSVVTGYIAIELGA